MSSGSFGGVVFVCLGFFYLCCQVKPVLGTAIWGFTSSQACCAVWWHLLRKRHRLTGIQKRHNSCSEEAPFTSGKKVGMEKAVENNISGGQNKNPSKVKGLPQAGSSGFGERSFCQLYLSLKRVQPTCAYRNAPLTAHNAEAPECSYGLLAGF